MNEKASVARLIFSKTKIAMRKDILKKGKKKGKIVVSRINK